jgi:hypothetical protein
VQPPQVKWYVVCHQALLMLAPVLIANGFIFETITNTGIDRAVGSLGIIIIFVWLIIKIAEKIFGIKT